MLYHQLGTVALRGEGGNPVRQAPPQLVKSLVHRHAGLGAASVKRIC